MIKPVFTRWMLVSCLISFVCSYALGQTVVKGKVVDEQTKEAIVGVSVKAVGSNAGTSTNEDGNYSLTVPDNVNQIEFSFLGYQTQSLAINGRQIINVLLTSDDAKLDEVVVVGYGTQSRRNVTGAVARVEMKETESLPNTNITQAVRGRVAGVQILDNGRPGQEGAVLIRGPRSLSGSNNPLIVLDGIIFGGSLSDINPNDILTMDILKDASASAIYGSRAANGVILITSKKGTTDNTTINANVYRGLSDFASEVNLFSPERYLQSKIDWRKQSGLDANPDNILSYLTKTEADNYSKGIVNDPYKMASQDGGITSYDINISGRSKSLNYFVSAALADEKGLVYNDNSKRNSLRINLDNQVYEWLKVGINTTYSRRNLSGINADLARAYNSSPFGTWFHEDGQPQRYIVEEDQVSGNAIYDAMMSDNDEIYDNLFSNIYGEIKLPFLKGLSYRVNFSPNLRWEHNYTFHKQDDYLTNNTTSASKYNKQSYDWLWENIVKYETTFGENHGLDLTLLLGKNHQEMESTTAKADQLSIDALGYNDLSLGNILTNLSNASQINGVSSMFRINYSYKSRYLFTLTARRDGSSVFASNNKYATFPSAAFAWIVSDEPFFKQLQAIDFLKFRLSYGAVGNQGIDPYQSLSLSTISQYVFGNGGSTAVGAYPSNMGNNNLKWETTYSTNVALDFGLFKSRLNGTLELYKSITKDLLVNRSIPTMNGYESILTNIGEIENKGIELSLNAVNIRHNNFEWNTSVAFSHNLNKINKLYGEDLDGDGREDDDIGNNWFIGHPITSFYDYVFDGIYQVGDAGIPNGSQPGYVRLRDRDNNGVIDARDRTIVGSGGQPKYRIGITNNFKLGQFTLGTFVNVMTGWVADFPLLNTAVSPNAPGRGINQLDAGYWTEENRSNTRPSLVYTNPLSHGWYANRNFVRIQDISLGYTFSRELVEKLKLQNLRVYVSGKNLYTFTDWPGSDPESGAVEAGELFPMPRIYTLGINISL